MSHQNGNTFSSVPESSSSHKPTGKPPLPPANQSSPEVATARPKKKVLRKVKRAATERPHEADPELSRQTLRLQKIEEYERQSLSHDSPVAACLGAMAASQLRHQVYFDAAIESVLTDFPPTFENAQLLRETFDWSAKQSRHNGELMVLQRKIQQEFDDAQPAADANAHQLLELRRAPSAPSAPDAAAAAAIEPIAEDDNE